MSLVCKVFETIVARAFTIAARHTTASFTYDFTPPLARFLDESCSAGSFVVKNDFVSTTDRTPKADADFIEINLEHAAESAMQSIPKRFSRLTVGSWPDDQTK